MSRSVFVATPRQAVLGEQPSEVIAVQATDARRLALVAPRLRHEQVEVGARERVRERLFLIGLGAAEIDQTREQLAQLRGLGAGWLG